MLGIPVTHATIANYETGATFPGMTTVGAMAKMYKKPVEWFLTMGPTLAGIRYRSLKSVRVSEKQMFEGEAASWFQVYVELENIFAAQHPAEQFAVCAGESDEKAAMRLREKLGIGDQPLPSVIDLLERFGVRVIQIESPARIDGFAGWFGSTPVVALNSALPNDRMRFNGGHELRHYLFDNCRTDTHGDAEEEEGAHNFASHLLMPETVLREAFKAQSMIRLVQYKERFGISLAAMIYRAKAGGIISAELYERLWRDFSRLGWRKEEPGQVKPDRPRRLEQFVELAVSEKKMSYSQVGRLGGIDEAVVRRRVLLAMGGETFNGDGSLRE
jgi:Zn-dependent peptidase ImmA (M78 family)